MLTRLCSPHRGVLGMAVLFNTVVFGVALAQQGDVGTIQQPVTQATTTTEAPWVVGLAIDPNGANGWCSGSVLSEHWVLTAAHCVDDLPTQTLVRIYYANDPGTMARVYDGRALLWPNPHYQNSLIRRDRDDDIALIYLTQGAIDTTITGRARLYAGHTDPIWRQPDHARDFTMIGWGRTSAPGSTSCVAGTLGTKRIGHGFVVNVTGVDPKSVSSDILGTHACGGELNCGNASVSLEASGAATASSDWLDR